MFRYSLVSLARHRSLAVAMLTMVMMCTTATQAVFVANSGQDTITVINTGTNAAVVPQLNGVTLYSSLQHFRIHDTGGVLKFEGDLKTTVDISSITSHLIFTYQIVNSTAGLDGTVSRVDVIGLDVWEHAFVDWRNDHPGDVAPIAAGIRANGSRISFQYDAQGQFSGQTSRAMFIATDAFGFSADKSVRIVLKTGESVTLATP